MSNTRILASCMVLSFAVIITACNSFKSNSPSIAISPFDSSHIKVEYFLPTHCPSLKLLNPYQDRTQQLRQDWKSLNDCGSLSAEGVIGKKNGCNTLSFTVPIEAKIIDRVNPIAYPIDGKGVLVHTATFSVDNSCGEVNWAFSSPGGSLIIDGSNRGQQTNIQQSKESYIYSTGVFFSYKKLARNTYIIASDTAPEKLHSGIENGSQKINDYFLKTYPSLQFSPPTLFIGNTIELGRSGFQADLSSPKMIRFGFFNWQENQLSDTLSTIAHEYAHILQPEIFFTLGGRPIHSEGGAEYLRWMTDYRLGWRDKNYTSWYFSNAVRQCLDATDNRPWRTIESRQSNFGLIPYACGLTIHTLALASRKNTASADQNLEAYYQGAKSNHDLSLSRALECGNLQSCNPEFLEDFFNSSLSTATVIGRQLEQLGLVKSRSYMGSGENLTPLSKKAFESLMIEDCGGTDLWLFPDKFITGKSAQCKSIPQDATILSVEGVSYFSEPLLAIDMQNKGCLKQHKVTLTTQDNKNILVPCAKEVILEKNYYDIDIDELLKLLE